MQQHFDRETCLVFPSGYQANLGAITSLSSPKAVIFSDSHNHASIVDGCRLSRATIRVYPHLSVDSLEEQLRNEPLSGRRLIVTDSVFSMDGSLAPVRELSRLAQQHDALLLVDEAHAVGLLGEQGQGLCAQENVTPDLVVGTFSKGLGSHGAFTASSDPIAQWLLNHARSFIYTTALPAAVIGASLAALEVVRSKEGAVLRHKVLCSASTLRELIAAAGLEPTGAGTPIVSLKFNHPEQATLVAQDLMGMGFLVWAFRPPTVPPGTSLIRISVTAAHHTDQIVGLSTALRACIPPEARSKMK